MLSKLKACSCRYVASILLFVLSSSGAVAGELSITTENADKRVNLSPHMEFLRDASQSLGITDVRARPQREQFQVLKSGYANFGMTPDAIWYRIELRNQLEPGDSMSYVLDFGFVTLDRIDLYLIREDGQIESFRAGNGYPPERGRKLMRTFQFPLILPPSESIEVYARIRGDTSHQIEFWLAEATTHAEYASREYLWFGVFYGILAALLFYNLFVAFLVRDSAYGYYIAYLLASGVLYLTLNGFLRMAFHGGVGTQQLWIMPLSIGLSGVFALQFMRKFLHTASTRPRIDALFRFLVYLMTVLCLAVPFVSVQLSLGVTALIGVLAAVLAFVTALAETIRGDRVARLLMLAWAFFVVGVILKVTAMLGFSGEHFISIYGMQIGAVMDATLLSFALAQRLHSLSKFMPQKVAQIALDTENDALLKPTRRMVVVCAVDLRGFTAFSASEQPETIIQTLNDYYRDIGDVADAHGGTVESFAGDGMVIFFNAPLTIAEPERQACAAALAMQAAFSQRQHSWPASARSLGLGIGIARGEATAGAIGFERQVQYSAIGPVTNLAARLCSDARHGEILVDEALASELPSELIKEQAGNRDYKGFSQPVPVWKVLSMAPC